MITKKTVIIAGAGSNRRAGFPLASELKAAILHFAGHINEDNQIPSNMVEGVDLSSIGGKALFSTEELKLMKDVASRLKRSSAGTLDDFLQRESPEINKIIKKFVAIFLVKAESISSSNGGIYIDNDWLALLLRRYGNKAGFSDDPLSVFNENLTIITFNYDLYIEFRIWETLRNDFNLKNDDKAKNLINKIKVIHPHGKIGTLSWHIDSDEGIVREYGDREFLKNNLDKVVDDFIGSPLNPEAQKTEIFYQEANVEILNAEKVLFVGFGYHDTVMQGLIPNAQYLKELDHADKFFGSFYSGQSPDIVYPFIKGVGVSMTDTGVDYASFLNRFIN